MTSSDLAKLLETAFTVKMQQCDMNSLEHFQALTILQFSFTDSNKKVFRLVKGLLQFYIISMA